MNYIEAIGTGFSGVEVHTFGDPTNYDDIIWDGGLALPSKETLDSWIASNSTGPNTRKITVYALRQRFTMPEKVAIEYAAIDRPGAIPEQNQFAALLRVVLSDLSVATFVDLDNPNVTELLQMFEQYGLIAPGRADIIINTPVQSSEVPGF